MKPDPRPGLLLVDDEPDILIALEDLLEADFRIYAATSGEAALSILAANPHIAAIVSDQRMPGMTGDRFLAAARDVSDADSILLTGYADIGAVTAALNAGGVSGYAAKPWEPEALRRMILAAAERTRLRRSLRREQSLLDGLMNHLPAKVLFRDATGRIIRLNGRMAEALGAPVEACLGSTLEELGAQPRDPLAEAGAAQSLEPSQSIEERPCEAGASWTETTYVPIPSPSGGLGHMVVIERDISEQKLAEQRLRQVDKLRALGTLAGGVAHDFNNLLTAILGSLELAQRRMPDEVRVRRYLDNAALAARKGAALTKRLLGFTRQEESQTQTIDIESCLKGMDDLLTRALGGGVQIDWRIEPNLWPTSAEPDQLELAVLNLCINARDAMPDGGRIGLCASNVVLETETGHDITPGNYVRIDVEDAGVGMSPELAARVLEPFFTTKPVGKGTGLGLSMVYGFAQRSGGGMEIDSEPGRGTRVSLFLPRSQEPQAAEEGSPEKAPRQGPRLATVLVVDDDASVRAVSAALLRELGHGVTEAQGAAEALRLLQAMREENRRPDLMLVDYAMPGMNGMDFITEALAGDPDIPVILATGYAELQRLPEGVRLLHKPFDQEALRGAIAQALAPPSGR